MMYRIRDKFSARIALEGSRCYLETWGDPALLHHAEGHDLFRNFDAADAEALCEAMSRPTIALRAGEDG
jgi:hypothetical protein